MDIVIKILLFFLVVQKVCCQTLTCNCSNDTKCLAQNVICIPEQFKDTIQNTYQQPQDIFVELKKVQIIAINDKLKEITFNVGLFVYWYDGRLQVMKGNEVIYLEPSDAKQIWIPLLELSTNLVSITHYKVRGESVLYGTALESIALFPNAVSIYSQNGSSSQILTNRYINFKVNHHKVTLLCDMYFEKFPFDKQVCKFEMYDAGYETSIKNVTMRKSEFQNIVTLKGYKAFAFPKVEQETISSQFGVETKFVVTFSLHREPSGYLIRYHLVCMILVFIGSISFLIEPKIVPGRAGLLVTLFLVLAAFFSNAQQETENSSVNALTMYIISCMIFLSFAMMYYGMILHNLRTTREEEDGEDFNQDAKHDLVIKRDRRHFAMYNILFILFNILYFVICFLM